MTVTITTDGSTALGKLQPRLGNDVNNFYQIDVQGTFDGATLAVQTSQTEAGTKKDYDPANLNFTAAGNKIFYVMGGLWFWLTLSNDGASTSVTVKVTRCDGQEVT